MYNKNKTENLMFSKNIMLITKKNSSLLTLNMFTLPVMLSQKHNLYVSSSKDNALGISLSQSKYSFIDK